MYRSNKSTRSKEQQQQSAATDLSSFSLAAALSEASPSSQQQQQQQQQPRRIFNLGSSRSQQSIATNASFATANESVQPSNNTPAHLNGTLTPASYFVDSSDDDTDDATQGYSNDPLAVLSRTESGTPTEISFASNNSSNTTNPEETIMPKKSSKKIAPMVEAVAPVEAAPALAPAAEVVPKEEPQAPTPVTTTAAAVTKTEDEAHFDVAQTAYGAAKDLWGWGRTVPLLTNVLGITEAVASKVLDVAVHMDLPAVDEKAVSPNLKRLDDDLITPVVLAIWKIVEPAVAKGEEMVVKPVMREVVPRVLAPLGVFGGGEKKVEEKKEDKVDASPTPEVVPALN